jgi:type II secretory pathway pseudopilin PulG
VKKNENGFSIVEVLLVFVVVALIGFIGWYVWQTKSNTDKNLTKSNTTSTSGASQIANTPAKQEAVDPYAGWKTYCDTATSGCFRYPSDWNDVSALDAQRIKASGQNKAGTVNLEYSEPVQGQDGIGSFSTKSLAVITNNTALKVVGGYYTVGNNPGYNIADTSLVQQLGLAEGKVSTINSDSGLYFTKSSNKAELSVNLNNTTGSTSISASQANDWFSSADGKLALQIVQSFYFK